MLFSLLTVPTSILLLLVYILNVVTLLPTANFTVPLHRPTSTSAGDLLPAAPIKGSWNVIWQPPSLLSLWTSALNSLPSSILTVLKFRNIQRLKKFYDFSIGACLLGVAMGTGGAGWITYRVWMDVWRELEGHVRLSADAEGEVVEGVGQEIVKRALAPVIEVSTAIGGPTGGGLRPLIPGLTVPWSHTPSLILALVVNQLIHELGHALSASLDDIQPSKLSFNLHYFLPSMTVEFPSVQSLTANGKMRIASSGPAHNLIIWFILWLLTFSGFSGIFWKTQSSGGVVVQDVNWTSPLARHLQPDDIITHLNDISLSPTSFSPSPVEKWISYLTSSIEDDPGRGWCITRSDFLALSPTLCDFRTQKGQGAIPFRSVETHGYPEEPVERCIHPHPILDIPSKACPCPDQNWLCVRPKATNILRIRVVGRKEKVVLWEGAREEVLRDVNVGVQAGRIWSAGTRTLGLILRYTQIIALSLFLFNLLPLPSTDGSQLLEALTEWTPTGNPVKSLTAKSMQATLNTPGSRELTEAEGYELASDEEADIGLKGDQPGNSGIREKPKVAKWKRFLRITAQVYMVAVCVMWVIGWGMILLLQSS
ncbi:hypothetical protein C349_04106 [Cryptococcus neoformans var. grubii Br795]|uniref:Endopeptidase S2P n=1 Tax=Cryptococcus neoformans Tu259-1 TaxID=1230072 RepID=A0A854Q7S0_CRYNE|nr:hypothetical protein C368_04249 [Cryptococcus neoformans var. grubii 125.91]OXG18261.1 hypothetical protein C361_04383 [Cryptococcus neoformans var. grubii Tu259-1]OXG80287.1 hypothetical protein C349_04106 [Cryptococcus neoformans var. grubii Br795]OXG84775.1 hypothetical protein C346_04025 [Cryptococcus neoformans var. grubii D17-1]OXG94778.1 hypothetical protein C345_03901 [Cryptococcus neoformans var. grubii A2-102-5]